MKPNMYLIILAIVVIVIYVVLKKKNIIKSHKNINDGYNLIILFDENHYFNINQISEFKNIA